jgi:putative transposase
MSLPRHAEDHVAYFVTSVTHERMPVFGDQQAAELLLNIVLYNKFICTYRIFGFVIMPDHFHMIIQPCGDMDLSAIIRRIKGTFTRFYNLYTGKSGSLWQKSFYDRGIRSRREFINTLGYMHDNPVRQELIADRREYLFSSSAYYECGEQRFALWIDSME